MRSPRSSLHPIVVCTVLCTGLAATAACGGSDPSTSASAASSGGEAVAGPAGRAVEVGFAVSPLPADDTDVPRATVAVTVRDETGASQRVELGSFMGCSEPAPADGTVLSLQCFWAGTGDGLHLTHVGDEVVVLRQDLASELTDAPRVPVRRITLAAGATVTAAP